jgi:D-alanyl-D-alanine carboxypeptidase
MAMENLEIKDRRPIFGKRAGDGLFSFILFLSSFLFFVSSASAYQDIRSPRFIPAKAAIVVDPNKSVVYAKNQDAKLPPASTTKLAMAMVVLDYLDPETEVTVSPTAAGTHSVGPRVRPYEDLTVADLLHLALMRSVNSAAVALAERTAGSEERFVELMNQKAQTIGAVNTRFANASGLPEGVQYTTVYDLTIILNEAIKYPLIKEILGKKECRIFTAGGRSLYLRNTNRLLWASDSVIGGKTGFTRDARHCFVGAFQTEEGPIVTAVLGTPSRNGLWRSTALLSSIAAGRSGIENAIIVYEKEVKRKIVKAKKKRKTHAVKLARSTKGRSLPDRT